MQHEVDPSGTPGHPARRQSCMSTIPTASPTSALEKFGAKLGRPHLIERQIRRALCILTQPLRHGARRPSVEKFPARLAPRICRGALLSVKLGIARAGAVEPDAVAAVAMA